MQIQAAHAKILDRKTDLLVIPLQKGEKLSSRWNELEIQFDHRLGKLLQQQGFEGKEGEAFIIPSLGTGNAWKILLIGLGDSAKLQGDSLRKIGAHVTKRAKEAKAKHVLIPFDSFPSLDGIPPRAVAEYLAEGLLLAEYSFHAYHKKSRDRAKKQAIETVELCLESAAKARTVERGLEEARYFAEGTHLARDLVNTPSADMAPSHMAEVARDLAASPRVTLKLLTRAQMEKLGMQAALAVGKGSDHEPVGVHLVYRPVKKTKKKIAIVGKAVTFDSGGLSLKPANGMMTMKIDMGGAAAVLGLFKLLPELKPNVEVHGIFLAVENMPSGSAYRPGDVVKAMNGKTIEVLNTDAEGRITLADALSYAVKQKPDAIIDLATLTGACVSALGEEMAGLLSNNEKLSEKIQAAAQAAGEPLWELPLYQPYKEQIKSKIADIKNIGGGGAGTITAALFLQNFVGDCPWAHLDIAGPAYTERETRPDLSPGASGYGVRTLARYLQAL